MTFEPGNKPYYDTAWQKDNKPFWEKVDKDISNELAKIVGKMQVIWGVIESETIRRIRILLNDMENSND